MALINILPAAIQVIRLGLFHYFSWAHSLSLKTIPTWLENPVIKGFSGGRGEWTFCVFRSAIFVLFCWVSKACEFSDRSLFSFSCWRSTVSSDSGMHMTALLAELQFIPEKNSNKKTRKKHSQCPTLWIVSFFSCFVKAYEVTRISALYLLLFFHWITYL